MCMRVSGVAPETMDETDDFSCHGQLCVAECRSERSRDWADEGVCGGSAGAGAGDGGLCQRGEWWWFFWVLSVIRGLTC